MKTKQKNKNIGTQFASAPLCIMQYYKDPSLAVVYGYIWSKNQLSKGVCTVSQETMALDTGISVRTIRDKTQKLIEEKLVKCAGKEYYEKGFTLRLLCNENKLKELDKKVNSLEYAITLGINKFNTNRDKLYEKLEKDETEFASFTDAFKYIQEKVNSDVINKRAV